jgi:hypothetical protein
VLEVRTEALVAALRPPAERCLAHFAVLLPQLASEVRVGGAPAQKPQSCQMRCRRARSCVFACMVERWCSDACMPFAEKASPNVTGICHMGGSRNAEPTCHCH